ncbi:MAG: UvrD-helicase domain-containing protein, partial [Clostridia bacterium]|nr:UvrD-helicase domain-containing protein [Clostridia bacterium]
TIQEKQYEIITLPENEQFIVQGVAGSGKTMILLHRLSFLMYNNERIKPRDVLVITPSDSFNAFIDELSTILELEKVKTSTIENYFLQILKNQGIDIAQKIDFNAKLPKDYLSYVYSDKFVLDVDKRLKKIFDGVIGMFTAEECKEMINDVINSCKIQRSIYEKIKNASLRVRRAVLGEIKEKPNGGLYYTKQFRQLFNAVTEVEEFLALDFNLMKNRGDAWFYKQLLSFYKAIKFIRRYSAKICEAAIEDLTKLVNVVEREIIDLKRYKIKVDGKETFTYAERIEKRMQTLNEITATVDAVKIVADEFLVCCDLADVLKGNSYLVAIGKCENNVDIARFFYKEVVKKIKTRYSVSLKYMYKSDPFTIVYLLLRLGNNLTPRHSFVFVDEAQDISPTEYKVLMQVNNTACFNVFGDLKQNVTNYRGLSSWDQIGFNVYNLNLNYRNTNQIVEYVSNSLSINMQAIGFDGEQVCYIKARNVTSYLSDKKGLKVVICSEKRLEEFSRKSYNVVRNSGKLSKKQINILTVYESKGLEFTAVAVADSDLTDNEKYIAYTRALKELAIIKE